MRQDVSAAGALFLALAALAFAGLTLAPTAGSAQSSGGAVAAPAPVAAPNGEVLFRQRCASCHVAAAGRAQTLGPVLTGINGRRAAAGSFAYSPALRASGITWTRATLDRYLTAPTRMVPGTRMVIAVSNPAQRAAIIAYLTR